MRSTGDHDFFEGRARSLNGWQQLTDIDITTGSGGSGGSTCVGLDDSTGQTEASCDELNISPSEGASEECGA